MGSSHSKALVFRPLHAAPAGKQLSGLLLHIGTLGPDAKYRVAARLAVVNDGVLTVVSEGDDTTAHDAYTHYVEVRDGSRGAYAAAQRIMASLEEGSFTFAALVRGDEVRIEEVKIARLTGEPRGESSRFRGFDLADTGHLVLSEFDSERAHEVFWESSIRDVVRSGYADTDGTQQDLSNHTVVLWGKKNPVLAFMARSMAATPMFKRAITMLKAGPIHNNELMTGWKESEPQMMGRFSENLPTTQLLEYRKTREAVRAYTHLYDLVLRFYMLRDWGKMADIQRDIIEMRPESNLSTLSPRRAGLMVDALIRYAFNVLHPTRNEHVVFRGNSVDMSTVLFDASIGDTIVAWRKNFISTSASMALLVLHVAHHSARREPRHPVQRQGHEPL
jgi:hypothetical protein